MIWFVSDRRIAMTQLDEPKDGASKRDRNDFPDLFSHNEYGCGKKTPVLPQSDVPTLAVLQKETKIQSGGTINDLLVGPFTMARRVEKEISEKESAGIPRMEAYIEIANNHNRTVTWVYNMVSIMEIAEEVLQFSEKHGIAIKTMKDKWKETGENSAETLAILERGIAVAKQVGANKVMPKHFNSDYVTEQKSDSVRNIPIKDSVLLTIAASTGLSLEDIYQSVNDASHESIQDAIKKLLNLNLIKSVNSGRWNCSIKYLLIPQGEKQLPSPSIPKNKSQEIVFGMSVSEGQNLVAHSSATEDIINGGKFTVLKGSAARFSEGKGKNTYKPLRDTLISNKSLISCTGRWGRIFIFTKDVEFNSPSAAASV